MKINSKMKKFLDEIVDKEKQSEIKINFNTAKNIIFPEFFEWEGCVLLRQDSNDNMPSQFSPNQFIPDRTAFEADYNHVHLNDFFSENSSPFQVFMLATKIILFELLPFKRHKNAPLRFYRNNQGGFPMSILRGALHAALKV